MSVAQEGNGINRVLVAGVPRSGTTWVGQTLARTADTAYVGEPDNEGKEPFALKAKLSLGRFPVLGPDDEAPSYEELWDKVFNHAPAPPSIRRLAAKALLSLAEGEEVRGAYSDGELTPRLRAVRALASPAAPQPAARNIVTKSVYAVLALEWVVRRWQPSMVVVLRNPLNVIASWKELGYRDRRLDEHPGVRARIVDPLGLPLPESGSSTLARLAWQFGVLNCALESGAERFPDWNVVRHEDLCRAPREQFRSLATRLGLGWTEEAEAFLVDSDRPGTGYVPTRVASQEPERWRQRLREDEVQEICEVLASFPLKSWQPLDAA